MNEPEARSTAPRPILRADYRPASFAIDRVDLRFELGDEATRVDAVLQVRRAAGTPADEPLRLDGEALTLLEVAVNGERLGPGEYAVDGRALTIPARGDAFEVQTAVMIRPQDNLELSGLYRSGGLFCTQCEAEGFRRITYFLDRPDVMARYSVTIVGDRARTPVLLSNGNRLEAGTLADGRHFVRWVDPFPKPSYLFALVAGDLKSLAGSFTTMSGRRVRLEIWVEPENLDKCEHALRSLERAMRWDEERFGREYDLDLYMIVAVRDFNMGAMENKGLNVFNAKYVLASPETATDDDYEAIESVIAHEYFHNWTGNRITCRDWFQLTLKEGLTVLRDQLFTADMTSAAVKRVSDVLLLRTAQFAEDRGPMAHPIRPESYVEMNNFYTATVYNKGAEVIRMIRTLVGEAGFRRGMDRYFERHDGQAVTCDDFRAAMADGGGRDLEQFGRWYSQVGTPILRAEGRHDAGARTFTLTLEQRPPRGRETAELLHVPVAVGLLRDDGASLLLRLRGDAPGRAGAGTRVLELRERAQEFVFEGVDAPPVVSLLRGFSAPVEVEFDRSDADLALLLGHDPDAFAAWDAGQELARRVLLRLAADAAAGRPLSIDQGLCEGLRRVVVDPDRDGSLTALALTLPDERLLGQAMDVVDVDALHSARDFALRAVAAALQGELWAVVDGDAIDEARFDRAAIDGRRLRGVALAYLVALGEPAAIERARRQFAAAKGMTEAQSALISLVDHGGEAAEEALAAFHARWRGDPLVLDKWFTIQAISSHPGTLDRVLALASHPDFNLRNPNRARALLGAFATRNQFHFHSRSGRGYDLLADQVIALDGDNPQVAARLVGPLGLWRRFDPDRQARMRAALERVAARPGLSRDVGEIVGRALQSP